MPAVTLTDPTTEIVPISRIHLAGRGVRASSCLLDIAAMLSPTLPLGIAAATLNAAQVVYVVMPVAFVAVWLWIQLWQGLTGSSFGKALLGLRLVRAADNQPPGFSAVLFRSGVFIATLGLASLPVMRSHTACSGLHDQVSGLMVIDVTASGSDNGGALSSHRLRRLPRTPSPTAAVPPGRC